MFIIDVWMEMLIFSGDWSYITKTPNKAKDNLKSDVSTETSSAKTISSAPEPSTSGNPSTIASWQKNQLQWPKSIIKTIWNISTLGKT